MGNSWVIFFKSVKIMTISLEIFTLNTIPNSTENNALQIAKTTADIPAYWKTERD